MLLTSGIKKLLVQEQHFKYFGGKKWFLSIKSLISNTNLILLPTKSLIIVICIYEKLRVEYFCFGIHHQTPVYMQSKGFLQATRRWRAMNNCSSCRPRCPFAKSHALESWYTVTLCSGLQEGKRYENRFFPPKYLKFCSSSFFIPDVKNIENLVFFLKLLFPSWPFLKK